MLGALIGAGASLIGGLINRKDTKDANKAAEAHALRQEALQKEFAQSGIQWKVKDAEAAGVHPLYALGANTMSYSPTQVGQSTPDSNFIGETGQNIGRAIQAGSSNQRKLDAIGTTMAAINLEGASLDNELKKVQIASAIRLANQNGAAHGIPDPFAQLPAGVAIEGQGDAIPLHHQMKLPEYLTNLKIAGNDWKPHPGWSNAQTYEDRYGEMSDYIFGPAIAASDYFYNMRNAKHGNPWNFFHRERK